MTLSSNNLNEIANLYESIVASEQEQLNEGAADAGVAARNMIGGAVKRGLNATADIAGAQYQGYAGQKTTSKDPIARASNAVSRAISSPVRDAGNFVKGLVTGQGDKAAKPAAPAKYKSSSDGKMYANYNDALAAHNSRLKSGTGSSGARPPAGGARPPAGGARPPAGGAGTTGGPKVLPTKPAASAKPAGSPMQQWAAAHSDLAAKVKPGQSGYGDIQKQRNAASLSAPAAPATSTLGRTVAAASRPQTAFTPRPATTAQATAAAPSTSPAASGSVATQTNKLAAMKQQPQVKPAGAGGAPRDKPLWEGVDAYDLVLEYLFDNGHVDTLEEAHYVMMELDAEIIQDIVEAHKPLPTQKMQNRRYYVHMKTGEAAGSSNNEKIRDVLDKYKKDPEGEAAKAKAKSKYKG
jgi:hypothetical protein